MGMRQRLPLFLLRDVPRRAQRKWALRLQHRRNYCDPIRSAPLCSSASACSFDTHRRALTVCVNSILSVPLCHGGAADRSAALRRKRGANANLCNPEGDMFAHSRELCAQLRQPDARRDDRLEHLTV
jgi:hypothetical protein